MVSSFKESIVSRDDRGTRTHNSKANNVISITIALGGVTMKCVAITEFIRIPPIRRTAI